MQRFRVISTEEDKGTLGERGKTGRGRLRTPALYVHCFVLLERIKRIKKRDMKVNSAPNQPLHPGFSLVFFLGCEYHS